ncbi:hypothetical protein CR513_20181, partial [Mucuna pruriens]
MSNRYASNFPRCVTNIGMMHGMNNHDSYILIIICKLDKTYPPILLDLVEHLPIHLLNKTILVVQILVDIFIGNSKYVVKNKTRGKGSICVFYLHCVRQPFSHHFKNFSLLITRFKNDPRMEHENF